MRSSGDIVIQPDSEGLYVKVVASGPTELWVVLSIFGILYCLIAGISIGEGDSSYLIGIPIWVLLLFTGVSVTLSKKELWLSKNGIRYRERYGLVSQETRMLTLVSPHVEWRGDAKIRGGYLLVMSYPHCGQTVDFFAYQGLSQEKAREICDAVEAYISKISTEE
jgi:hypothetical protein